jgi:glycosyltransferase involved in cell wall biosynthesis
VFPGFLDASNGALPQGGEKVVYFGHRSQQEVKQALCSAHYMLMPSRFLETFGLSALEAISYGVPVIGYAKGGLAQFLLSEHAIHDSGDDAKDTGHFVETVE